MSYESYNFTSFGDATKELKELYSQGYHLVAATTPFAVTKRTDDGEHIYLYAIEYFLERPKQ